MEKITGIVSSRRVFLGTEAEPMYHEVLPEESQAIVNHSPDGFAWGYAGSGPSQLALAILMEFIDATRAQKYYQQFKFDIIANLDKDKDFVLPVREVDAWIDTHAF